MLQFIGWRIWLLVAVAHCANSVSSDFHTSSEFNRHWHADSLSPQYESAIPPSEFYLKQILKQMTLLNKKFDLMMIGMNGPTVRDEDIDDENVRKIALNDTKPNCESLMGTMLPSGIYRFERSSREKDIEWLWNVYAIYCDQSAGGGWTVIQKRTELGARIGDFRNTWEEYARGFGRLDADFWMGNEWIHRLTTNFGPYELRVELQNWNGSKEWAQYSEFQIGSKEENYRLLIGGYEGNATDVLSPRNSTPFSTYDRRNGLPDDGPSCFTSITGGWWYLSDCMYTSLNGDYGAPYSGVIWDPTPDVDGRHRRLNAAKMMIRLKNHTTTNAAPSETAG